MEYATWDDRVEKFRIPGINYRQIIEVLQQENTDFIDKAKAFGSLELNSQLSLEPYPHQAAARLAWKQAGRQGVVVLPTGAGKTLAIITTWLWRSFYHVNLEVRKTTPHKLVIVLPMRTLVEQTFAVAEKCLEQAGLAEIKIQMLTLKL